MRTEDGTPQKMTKLVSRGRETFLPKPNRMPVAVRISTSLHKMKPNVQNPPMTYARLQQIKKKYDPTNLFRMNQNIKPE
uniref:BBE domain-containing protein n=1 Tax=Vibrio parahaemolyticus TaxID=670 RepID=UPI0038924F49